MPVPTILFVSHSQQQCGVYQFGRSVGELLPRSTRYRFVYREVANEEELQAAALELKPAVLIYNHHFSTLPWLDRRIIRRLRVPQAGILHEVTQEIADRADTSLFDYHIAPDPTLRLDNPIVFKTGRLLTHYVNRFPEPETVTVGCFGFGTAGKGFDKVVARVQEEYDRAVIRMHMPVSTFADANGAGVAAAAQKCRDLLTKPGIDLRVTHDFLSMPQLLDFLAGNTVNAFFYDDVKGRGISSVIDHALAVGRPIAISRCSMFRHVLDAQPSICAEDTSLREIIAHGDAPLRPFCDAWTEVRLIEDYERAMDRILARPLPLGSRGRPDQLRCWAVRKSRGALRRGRVAVAMATGRRPQPSL